MTKWFTEKHSDTINFSIEVSKTLYSSQTKFQKLEVFENPELGKFFTLDDYLMITEKDEFIYHDMIVHVPMAVHPKAQRILVIGAGDGGTVRELCRYKTIEHIDMVEIDEEVVTVCKKYFPNSTTGFNDPRVQLYFMDGLAFVSSKIDEYDLIIVDSTDPFSVGEGLFTKTFYKDCFRALKDDGILVNQHESPFYTHYQKNMQRAHKRIKETFPIARVYQAFIPTYASGHWLFGFASKKYDPIKGVDFEKWLKLGLKTKYYNPELHLGSFALPNYVKELLEKESL
ncbi:MAG: polyamine aminopropyltransferase [Erysipelotrichaceae bacterium]|nr:polyamine aminopropyltransferase [Erysipelotrichaceae bacterium]